VVGFDGAATTVTVAAGEEAEVPHGLDGGGTATAAVVAGGTGLLSGVKRGYRDPDAADRSPVFNGRGALASASRRVDEVQEGLLVKACHRVVERQHAPTVEQLHRHGV
jgi:hypothetical protein